VKATTFGAKRRPYFLFNYTGRFKASKFLTVDWRHLIGALFTEDVKLTIFSRPPLCVGQFRRLWMRTTRSIGIEIYGQAGGRTAATGNKGL